VPLTMCGLCRFCMGGLLGEGLLGCWHMALMTSAFLRHCSRGEHAQRALIASCRYNETIAVFSNASGVGLGPAHSTVCSAQQSGALVQILGGGGGGSGGQVAVTALAFRTGVGAPLMAAGGGTGASSFALLMCDGRQWADFVQWLVFFH
jgi:hypothetical protein